MEITGITVTQLEPLRAGLLEPIGLLLIKEGIVLFPYILLEVGYTLIRAMEELSINSFKATQKTLLPLEKVAKHIAVPGGESCRKTGDIS